MFALRTKKNGMSNSGTSANESNEFFTRSRIVPIDPANQPNKDGDNNELLEISDIIDDDDDEGGENLEDDDDQGDEKGKNRTGKKLPKKSSTKCNSKSSSKSISSTSSSTSSSSTTTTKLLIEKSFTDQIARSRSIDLATAKKIKTLLFGCANQPIGVEWRYQYFTFTDENDGAQSNQDDDAPPSELWYGLRQHRGGPCGILAALQGYLCAEIFHRKRVERAESDEEDFPDAYRYRCLAYAIGSMLWQIGGVRRRTIVAYETNKSNDEFLSTFARELSPLSAGTASTTTTTTTFTTSASESSSASASSIANDEFVPDGITEQIRLIEFETETTMIEFLVPLLAANRHSIGAVSLAYSCVATRGIDRIGADYDCGSIDSLLTRGRALCTQELINLTLIGRAVSNVFDREVAVSNDIVLRGITRQSLIGFLTLHEHDGAFQVGACYKNPKLPIYVVLSEYHFTLLFSKISCINDDKSGKNNDKKFDLFYYDGLLGHDHEIRLTIDPDPRPDQSVHESNPNMCPIECVIRTKWPNATIDWNGTSKLF